MHRKQLSGALDISNVGTSGSDRTAATGRTTVDLDKQPFRIARQFSIANFHALDITGGFVWFGWFLAWLTPSRRTAAPPPLPPCQQPYWIYRRLLYRRAVFIMYNCCKASQLRSLTFPE